MRLILAPMEGVVDYPMRQLLTQLGGYDRCVTEFVRVTQQVLPARVFYRHCPELHHGSRTQSGTPVYVQLLGGDAVLMAKNAVKVAQLGALGIDLNFGCPSKTVNKHDGGSALLREPQRIIDIVKAVRDAVDESVPITTKIRLGFDHTDDFEQIALGVVNAGANELCVHARTRVQGYKPPAHWHQIAAIKDQVSIPIIANGEIWSVDDARTAQAHSHCQDLMLGRGSLSRPDLARMIRAAFNHEPYQALIWQDIQAILLQQLALLHNQPDKYITSRLKQWLLYLKRSYPEAVALFQTIKRLHDADAIKQLMTHSSTKT
ncbi:MAG: tRNA dihydrouridine synthase [bacterium]